jgi:hypothetical protein
MEKDCSRWFQRLSGCFRNGNAPEERDVPLALTAEHSVKARAYQRNNAVMNKCSYSHCISRLIS